MVPDRVRGFGGLGERERERFLRPLLFVCVHHADRMIHICLTLIICIEYMGPAALELAGSHVQSYFELWSLEFNYPSLTKIGVLGFLAKRELYFTIMTKIKTNSNESQNHITKIKQIKYQITYKK